MTKKLSLLIILIISNVNAQDKNLLEINQKISENIIENKKIRFYSFNVNFKDVEFPIYENGEVPSSEYILESEKLQKFITYFEAYENEYNIAKEKYEEIKTISTKIDEYLNSKEKYKTKEEYLIEAQKIASKYNLATEFKSGNVNVPKKIIYLHQEGKKTSKNDLDTYKEYINKISLEKPKETQGYREYKWQREKLDKTKKTQSGLVLSGKTQKKEIYILKDTLSINYTEINGSFTKSENKYKIVLKDVPNKFIKFQIIDEDLSHHDKSLFSITFYLLKKTDSNDYIVINEDYIVELEIEQKNNELFAIINKLGFKEFKDSNGDYYIKSKKCLIKLDSWTKSELKLNPNYISNLDNDQLKIENLVKETIPHSTILDKYIGIYNIKRRNMSTADINTWKKATTNAQLLHNKIYSISEKYDGNYSFSLLNKTNTFEVFLDNLLASKGVLNM